MQWTLSTLPPWELRAEKGRRPLLLSHVSPSHFYFLSLISSRSIQGGAAARACGEGPAGANGGAALGPAVGLAGSRASALVPGCSTKQKESETEREK